MLNFQDDQLTIGQSRTTRPRRVLVVEDDRIAQMMIEQQLLDLGYEPTCASSGRDALSLLLRSGSTFDVVLLDRIMPGIDGLGVVREMAKSSTLSEIPAIMLTGANSAAEISEGIDAGVFHYLEKPVDPRILQSVLSAAMRQVALTRKLGDDLDTSAAFVLLDAAKFNFRTLQEAETLAGFLANCYPDPDRALRGIAALLFNAVEHGICEIGYELKGELLADSRLQDEVETRLASPQCRGRVAEAAVSRKEDGLYLVVTDPGPGFNWRSFLEIDPSRASTTHGRGIAQARAASFDKLSFNPVGNRVIALTSLEEKIEW